MPANEGNDPLGVLHTAPSWALNSSAYCSIGQGTAGFRTTGSPYVFDLGEIQNGNTDGGAGESRNENGNGASGTATLKISSFTHTHGTLARGTFATETAMRV
jgi:hypothetical protein